MFGFLIPMLSSFATSALADIAIFLGRELAGRTDNKLDDTIVDVVEGALPSVVDGIDKGELKEISTDAAKVLLVAAGDELVKRTDNDLDDAVLGKVKEVLAEE
jgi:hypothetical protein